MIHYFDFIPNEIIYNFCNQNAHAIDLKNTCKHLYQVINAYIKKHLDNPVLAEKLNREALLKGLPSKPSKVSFKLSIPLVLNSSTKLYGQMGKVFFRSLESSLFNFTITADKAKQTISPFPHTEQLMAKKGLNLPNISDESQDQLAIFFKNRSKWDERICEGNYSVKEIKNAFSNNFCLSNNNDFLVLKNEHIILNLRSNGKFLLFNEAQQPYLELQTTDFLLTHENLVIYRDCDFIRIFDTSQKNSKDLYIGKIKIACLDMLREHLIIVEENKNHFLENSDDVVEKNTVMHYFNVEKLKKEFELQFNYPIYSIKFLLSNYLLINKQNIFDLANKEYLGNSFHEKPLFFPTFRYACNEELLIYAEQDRVSDENKFLINVLNFFKKTRNRFTPEFYDENPSIYLSQNRVLISTKNLKKIYDLEGNKLDHKIPSEAKIEKIQYHILFYSKEERLPKRHKKICAMDLESGKLLWTIKLAASCAYLIYSGNLFQLKMSSDFKEIKAKITVLH